MVYDIQHIVFSYRASQRPVLNDVTLHIAEGDIVCILGRNGAGKSTLFGCMLGLKKPQKGTVFLKGRPVQDMSEREVAAVVGYVPQSHMPTFGYTVYDFVLMGCASRIKLLASPNAGDRRAAELAMEEMGIAHLAERPYTELSGGERQQATIARAIVSRPQIILFDEPTAHLDFCNQVRVLRIIKKLSGKGYAVAITTHDPNHALLLEGRTALLDGGGRLIAGDTKTILTERKLQEIYGGDIRMGRVEPFGQDVCIYPKL